MKVELVILIIMSIITCLQFGGTMGSPRPVCNGFAAGYSTIDTCCLSCLQCQDVVRGFSFSKCANWCTVSYLRYIYYIYIYIYIYIHIHVYIYSYIYFIYIYIYIYIYIHFNTDQCEKSRWDRKYFLKIFFYLNLFITPTT